MSTAFTPGPWQVFACGRTIEVQDKQGQPVVFWAGFDRSEIPLRRHRANADLIAASPALLEAAQAAEAVLGRQKWLAGSTDPEAVALFKLRAAIARATGSTS